MRITEIFAFGYSDDCYHGGRHHYYGEKKYSRYGGGGKSRFGVDDRDTPLARLKGSRAYLQ